MSAHDRTLGIERRTFLRLPAAVAIGTWLGLRDELLAQEGTGRITFDDFCDRVGAMALQVIADADRDEDAYLFQVAALARRIADVPAVAFGQPYKGIIQTGRNYRGSGIVVVQWAMAAGLTYPAHNHPHYNGVTLGLEGECRMRNFDPVGQIPRFDDPLEFQLRETQDQLLTPGRVVSIMSSARDNIHTLRTESHPVRGIDVMTLIGKHEGFSFVEIDAAPQSDGVHSARWGERIAR